MEGGPEIDQQNPKLLHLKSVSLLITYSVPFTMLADKG